MKDKIKDDPLLAEDTLTDHNNVDFLINMGNGLKIFKLVVVILNITYFIGISFMIISEVNMTIARMNSQSYLDNQQEYFIEYFGLEELSAGYKTILMVYYSFTSLSTVGLGDLNPRSDCERIFCSFMLLFGVAIFSYIMGIFIEVLEK